MPADTQALKQLYAQLKADRSNVESVWNKIERFIHPLGSGRNTPSAARESSVEWERFDVWDFTAISGAEKLAASIHGSVTSPAIRWFRLTFQNKSLANDVEANKWLEEIGDTCFDVLQESDFNTEISSADIDLVVYGNAFIIAEAAAKKGKWAGLDFTAVPIHECYFTENSRGTLDVFIRKLSWTPKQMVDKFGEEGVPEPIREKAGTPHGQAEKMDVCFAIFHRENGQSVYDERGIARILPPDERPVGSVYFLAESGEQLGEEDGYYEFPAFHVAWQRTTGSIWGHGPGHVVLPTVKLLNALLEQSVNAGAKVIDPPLLVTERDLLSDPDMTPGGLTVCRDPNGIKPLESATRFNVIDAQATELRAMIRRVMHEDELVLKDSPAMTATESQIRYELMNRILGSTLARLQSDLLDPLIHLVLGILFREKRLPPPPASVRAQGGEYGIEYQGPLARAQRTDEVSAIERLGSFVAALSKLGFVDAHEIFDSASATREVAKRLGCPAGVLVSEEEQQKRAKQRQALQAAAQHAEVARAQGEALQQAGDARAAIQQSMPAQPPPLLAPTLPA